jgi:tellurite resistance protein TerC
MEKIRQRSFRLRLRKLFHLEDVSPFIRRIIVGVIGGTVLIVGVAMIVLPGPAVVVVPLGLAILGTEFLWARIWLRRARKLMAQAKEKVSSRTEKK